MNISIYTYIYICCRFKRKTEAQAIFLNLFTVLLIVQMEVCDLSIYEETNGSYPFGNELNGQRDLPIYKKYLSGPVDRSIHIGTPSKGVKF
jgi:hypothetical protein